MDEREPMTPEESAAVEAVRAQIEQAISDCLAQGPLTAEELAASAQKRLDEIFPVKWEDHIDVSQEGSTLKLTPKTDFGRQMMVDARMLPPPLPID